MIVFLKKCFPFQAVWDFVHWSILFGLSDDYNKQTKFGTYITTTCEQDPEHMPYIAFEGSSMQTKGLAVSLFFFF